MCLRFQFCTHQRVCILYFLKKSQICCTLVCTSNTFHTRLCWLLPSCNSFLDSWVANALVIVGSFEEQILWLDSLGTNKFVFLCFLDSWVELWKFFFYSLRYKKNFIFVFILFAASGRFYAIVASTTAPGLFWKQKSVLIFDLSTLQRPMLHFVYTVFQIACNLVLNKTPEKIITLC
jgi:hypothetical protein